MGSGDRRLTIDFGLRIKSLQGKDFHTLPRLRQLSRLANQESERHTWQ